MERTLRKTVAAFINDHREAEKDPLATGGACAEVTGSTIHRGDGGRLKRGDPRHERRDSGYGCHSCDPHVAQRCNFAFSFLK